MADYDSSLPAKTLEAGDIDVFLSDATTPAQKLKVNADGSIDTNFAAGAKIIVTDGTEDLAVNVDGSINAVVTATDLDIRNLTATDVVTVEDGGGSLTVDGTVAATQSGTWDIGTLTAITNDVNIADGGNSITVDASALDIRPLTSADVVQANLFDEAGAAFSLTNPLAVEVVSDASGDEIVSYNTSAALASAGTANHDYSVTALKTLLINQIWVSGSAKLKAEVLVDAVPVFVGFNSTANPNIEIPMHKIVKGAAGDVVRITITNRDNQAQDVYSTLLGLEV